MSIPKSLLDLLSGSVDVEKDEIINKTAKEANDKLVAIASGNPLALEYVTEMYLKIFTAIAKVKISFGSDILPTILRLVANTIETRNRLAKELNNRREAELKTATNKGTH